MAFGFNQSVSINVGGEIADINPEVIGFSAFSRGLEGAKKLKLLPSPWPSDRLPPATSALLAVGSQRGVLAAAGPDALVLASTETVRRAFQKEAKENDVVADFTPDATLPVPPLRQIAFSADEDFLVISAENEGGLAVFAVDDLLQGKKEPGRQIGTGGVAVRALLPNPDLVHAQYMAVVLDSGRMDLVDVTTGNSVTVRDEGVTCAAWSIKGKAFVAGFADGTATIYMTDTLKERGKIPRPPNVGDDYTLSGVFWLTNEEFFLVHSPSDLSSEAEALFNIVNCDKNFGTFSFTNSPFPLLWPAMDGPTRKPPIRYSIARLRKWEPILNDMLIVAGANSSDIVVLTNSSEHIASDQQTVNEYQKACLIDSRAAAVPRMSLGDDGESAIIGDALDLSSKDKVPSPAARLEDITESPTPLPAYLILTHEGILTGWWVVHDKSVQEGRAYPGLTYLDQKTISASTPAKAATTPAFGQPVSSTPAVQPSSVFGQPSAAFGASTPPKFGATGFGSTTPAFGKPAQPAFGQTSTPTFGKPSVPAFGAPSQPGMAATGFGSRQSPWGAPSQASASQTPTSPFTSNAGDASGFSKFGAKSTATGSAFSSFGSTSSQSGFSALGQQKSAFGGATQQKSPFSGLGEQKSAFSGGSGGFKGLSTEPSFGGSTVTIPSGTGSSFPSWAGTPASQGSVFGQPTSSFGSNIGSETSDAQNRERDEATPTPQPPPTQAKNVFGLPSNGFKLGTTFQSDGTSKDDIKKPATTSGSSFFGGGFASTLPPATPDKPDQGKGLFNASTTPATQPKSSSPLSFAVNTVESSTPKATPKEEAVVPEDAPLPPDFTTYKVPKTDDDLPPLAGSPPVKVEVPGSSVSSGRLSDEDEDAENENDDDSQGEREHEDDIEVEEDDGADDETEEPSPSDAARRVRTSQSGFALQQSVNQSPRILPAAPTPPPARVPFSGQPPFGHTPFGGFGQTPKASPLSFGQSAAASGTAPMGGAFKQPPSFPPPNRPVRALRSPSPVRAASTSALSGIRREPLPVPGNLSNASSQQPPKPPTPEPQVSDLVDDEDERIRRELESEIEPSRTLDPFLARQEYSGVSAGKTGTAAQIEIVYRDINCMVDTLGLNWRSLKAFIDYHKQQKQDSELNRAALEEVLEQGIEGPWFDKRTFAEIETLKNLEDELAQELDRGRVQDAKGKVRQLHRLLGEQARMNTKVNEYRRHTVIARENGENFEGRRKAPLPMELAQQQKALRQEHKRLLEQLGKAEEELILLKTRLASRHAEGGKLTAMPTVDAVKATIKRVTGIIEQKNNHITLLENMLTKLSVKDGRLNSPSSRQPVTPRQSRRARDAQSPFATPPTNASRMSLRELNRKAMTPDMDEKSTGTGYGFFYTPEGTPTSGRDLVRLGDQVEGNLAELRQSARRRRKVAEDFASALVGRGIKQTHVNQKV